MRLRHYCWLLVFLVVSGNAFAYTWTMQVSPYATGGTPRAACQAHINTRQNPSSYTIFAITMTSNGTAAECAWGAFVHSQIFTTIARSGSCSGVYNPADGSCTAAAPNAGESCGTGSHGGLPNFPKIINTAGNCVFASEADKQALCTSLSKSNRTGYILVGYDSSNSPINPGSIDQQGCVASVNSVDHCKAPATKATGAISLGPAPQRCRVGLSFSGQVAEGEAPAFVAPGGGQEGLCVPGDDCSLDDLPDVTDSQPCTYTTDSEGRKVCESFNYHGKPGDGVNCGTFNGQFRCEGTKPTSNGISIGTVIEEKDNPDGTKTITKTDIHNKVVCSGVGSCTTQTTKSTTVTIKDVAGNTVSQNGSCTGPNCAPNGTGNTGDSDGDGISDCAATNGCSEEEGEGIGGQDWYEPGDETYVDVIGGFAERVQDMPAVQGVGNFLTFTPSGACPIYEVTAWEFTIRLDQWCGDDIPWDLVQAIIIGLFAMAAFRIAFL